MESGNTAVGSAVDSDKCHRTAAGTCRFGHRWSHRQRDNDWCYCRRFDDLQRDVLAHGIPADGNQRNGGSGVWRTAEWHNCSNSLLEWSRWPGTPSSLNDCRRHVVATGAAAVAVAVADGSVDGSGSPCARIF